MLVSLNVRIIVIRRGGLELGKEVFRFITLAIISHKIFSTLIDTSVLMDLCDLYMYMIYVLMMIYINIAHVFAHICATASLLPF